MSPVTECCGSLVFGNEETEGISDVQRKLGECLVLEVFARLPSCGWR